MSCLDYKETWETMNSLEFAFNKIQALEGMVQYLQGAVDADDTQVIKETTAAISDYLPKYTEEYQEAFNNAWDNVVNKLERPLESEYDHFENPVGHLNPPESFGPGSPLTDPLS